MTGLSLRGSQKGELKKSWQRCFGDVDPGSQVSPTKPSLRPDHPLPSWEHPEKAAAAPHPIPPRRPAQLLPREKVSAAGAAGWVGVARGSGNRPKAPPPPASRPTARRPGERKRFFQKLRGSERTVCAPQGQVGKWSRRRRGEEAKGGERGAPLPRPVPAFGSCPLDF